MAQRSQRRVDVTALIAWITLVLVIVVAAANGIGGRGTLISLFVGSLILSGRVFIREE